MKRMLAVTVLLSACVAGAQSSPACAVRVPLTLRVPITTSFARMRIKVGKQEVRKFRVERTAPRRFVLVLDASGSMSTTDPRAVPESRVWSMETDLAEAIVKSAPSETSARLVVFGGDSDSSEFTNDHSVVLKKIDAASKQLPKGRTALYDAIERAAKAFGDSQPGDYIVVVSDGGDNASKDTSERLERTLIAAGIRLFAITPTLDRPRSPEELEGRYTMQHLSTSTGGMFIDADRIAIAKEETAARENDLSGIGKFIQSVAQEFYLVHLTLPSTGKREKLDMKPPVTSKTQPLLYPRWIEACPKK